MANIVIGTAGHIDHGKTTLIKALTGIETDTTKEEKARGMSINLGFAYFNLPNEQRVGIIDVPGHEKFIKNMVAGLPGINLVLLVIDSAEGIMPQTKEHIDILHLLGIKDFIIVLSKVDSVDPDLRELVIDDIQEQLIDTNLVDAPIIETDAISGKGIKELIETIQTVGQDIIARNINTKPRINVDRVFSVKGFGTVVTGTLIEGTLHTGDNLVIYPSCKKTKIRNIQVHESNVEQAEAGQRTALNLANIKSDEVERGDVLTVENNIQPSWMLDVQVECLNYPDLIIGLWDRVRLLIGTKEVLARVVPLGVEQINAGETGFLQLRLEEQVAVKKGDRFILRTYSPVRTIAGGVILDAQSNKHKRFDQGLLDSLNVSSQGNVLNVLDDFLSKKKEPFTKVKDMATHLNLDEETIQDNLQQLIAVGSIVKLDNQYIHRKQYETLQASFLDEVHKYHKQFRLRYGMPIEELRSKFKNILTSKEIDALVKAFIADDYLKEHNNYIAAMEFDVSYNKYHLQEKERIENILLEAKFTPPPDEELIDGNKDAAEVLESLEGNTIIRLGPENVIHKNFYLEAVDKIKDYILTNGSMTLAEFRDITGSSRKYSMLILEYTDKQNITKRFENKRLLNE